MAEWSNALVLKTSEGHTSGGSNPSFSASKFPNVFNINILGFYVIGYLYDYCTASDLKPQKIQPKTLNSTPHPFKINLFSFWRYAGEMGI